MNLKNWKELIDKIAGEARADGGRISGYDLSRVLERAVESEKSKRFIIFSIILLLIFFILLPIGMTGCPRYDVWQKGLKGKAELKRAEWNRQIAIKEAEAKKESASKLAEAKFEIAKGDAKAEVVRAKGVAEANEIIGKSLKGNEAYLRYLWINGLHDGSSEVIYVPTEANLPILEATRRLK